MVGFASRVALGLAIAAALSSGSAAHGPGATDWPTTNYDQTANRYSPLDQITAANVRSLKQVWSFHIKPAGFTGALREDEAIPIVIGNTMYLGSPYGAVHAIDATTGTEKWKFQLPNSDRPSKRGVAYWPGNGVLPPSIIFGTIAGSMYSVKASDGTPNAAFGQNGVVNLKTPEVMQTGMDASYSLLSSPTIYKNLIIIGAGTGEGAGGSKAGTGPAGDTRAFDATNGKLVWTFHTVPRPGEFGYDTWKEGSAKDRSGVNVWGYTSLDVERGILYMPIGAPNNDRVGVDRPGNNLFSSSVVAVDANTGKYLWHFQVVHHDIWDYDTQSAPLLVDLQRDGKTVPAVVISTKMGLLFTLNRVTGKPIFDVEERPVPKSDLPREQTSPTQPFPVKPPPLTQNTISRDNLYKGEPQHQSYCEHMVDDNDMRLGGPYMPIAFNRYSMSPPGPAGGINFWGSSYDPKLHLFISNTTNMFQPMRLILRPDGSYINSGPLAGLRRFGDPDRRLLCGPTPWGELVAVNMDTGDIAYRKTLGVSDMLPAGLQDTGRPSSGGVMLTASGLTFVGGTDDFRFRAFATATGDQLWEIKMPSSIETTPITYLGSDGRQFVTVVSTGGGLTGSAVTNDEIIAFALPSPAGAASQEPGYPITITAPGKGPYTFPQGYQTPWDKIEITVTEKMSPNLFVLHGSQGLDPAHPDASGGRAMALFGPDGVLMVDTQNRQVADKTLKALRSFTDGPIKVLVNTHLHSDHTGANAFFAKQGALIYAQDDLRNEMLRPPPRANGQPAPPPDMTSIPVATYRYNPAMAGQPAVTFNMNGEAVDFIPMMPSHTAGDTIVRFRKANVIYIEDFYRNFGYPFADQANGGSIRGMIDAVDLIRNLAGPETTLIPGHGTLIKKDDLLPYRAMLVDILAKVKTLRDQGKSLKDVLAANLTAPYDKTTQGDTQQSKDRFITEVYDEVKDFPPVVDGKRTMPAHP